MLYLIAGVAGAPVFADGRSGLAIIAGPTGGYLLGFPIVAFLLGLLAEAVTPRPLRQRYAIIAGGMLIGHAPHPRLRDSVADAVRPGPGCR